MPDQVEAIFECEEKTTFRDGSHKLVFAASTDGENCKDFTEATPFGQLEILVSAGRPAADLFVPGKTYKLTFELEEGD